MRNKYRFRHQPGRAIQVMFAHIPGKWISTGTEDMSKAVLWAENRLNEDLGIVVDKSMTLEQFAKGFFTEEDPQGFRHRNMRRGADFSSSYYPKKQAQLDNYILPAHGSYLLTAINDVMIEDFFLDLKSFRSDRDLSDDTKNKVLETYSDVMDEARRKGYIKYNPCDKVKPIVARNAERQAFTEEELARFFPDDRKQLIRIWWSLQWAVFFLIQRDTGFRPGEVAALSKLNYYPEFKGLYTDSNVDWRTRQVKRSIKTTKKGQPFKIGFLQNTTVELLEELIRSTDSEYLFILNGKYINSDCANKHLQNCAKRANVDLNGRTEYSFRHSYQTHYIGRIPERALQLLMGHTKTRKEYTHLSAEQTLERVSLMLTDN